jgi:hypothetical protein
MQHAGWVHGDSCEAHPCANNATSRVINERRAIERATSFKARVNHRSAADQADVPDGSHAGEHSDRGHSGSKNALDAVMRLCPSKEPDVVCPPVTWICARQGSQVKRPGPGALPAPSPKGQLPSVGRSPAASPTAALDALAGTTRRGDAARDTGELTPLSSIPTRAEKPAAKPRHRSSRTMYTPCLPRRLRPAEVPRPIPRFTAEGGLGQTLVTAGRQALLISKELAEHEPGAACSPTVARGRTWAPGGQSR